MIRKPKSTPDAPEQQETQSTPEPLWSQRATGGGRGKALGVRWTVFVLLILLAMSGVFRGFFTPVNKTIINEAPTISISAVGEYAASFTREWFTWDDGKAEERRDRLIVFNPALTNPGWNGQGSQTVTEARVFSQEEVAIAKLSEQETKDGPSTKGQKRYLITVRVTVDTSPTPFYVQVLAAEANGAYSVLSVPTPVPSPLLVPVALPQNVESPEADPAVTGEIEAQLSLFFTAWATGDSTLSRFIKTGTIMPALGGGITLKAVDRVYIPKLPEGENAEKRSVVAYLTWAWPGGASTAPAAYTVDLVREAGQWFVTDLRGGIADRGLAPLADLGSSTAPEPSEGDSDTAVPTTPTEGAGSGADQAPPAPDEEAAQAERGEESPDEG